MEGAGEESDLLTAADRRRGQDWSSNGGRKQATAAQRWCGDADQPGSIARSSHATFRELERELPGSGVGLLGDGFGQCTQGRIQCLLDRERDKRVIVQLGDQRLAAEVALVF